MPEKPPKNMKEARQYVSAVRTAYQLPPLPPEPRRGLFGFFRFLLAP